MSRIVRRVRQAGTYFVTTHTWQRRKLFSKSEWARIVLEQLLDCRDRGFYKLHAFVIMPDHLHLLLTPAENTSLEKAMQMIKGESAHKIKHDFQNRWPVWQPGFHDRWMRDAIEYQSRLRYIAENPVSAKLVERAEEYAFSFANAGFRTDISQFDERTSGAKAHLSQCADVAAKAATHKTHAAAT